MLCNIAYCNYIIFDVLIQAIIGFSGKFMQRHFSLILATVGRYREVEDFLNSLEMQTYRNFSVVLVDQNPEPTLLAPLIERYETAFDLFRVTSPKGLSRARNAGLRHYRGDVVCFPDDDCIYPPALLASVNAAFDAEGADVLVGRQVDSDDDSPPVSPSLLRRVVMRFLRGVKRGESVRSLFFGAPSITLFFSRSAVERTGEFDESLGAGAGTPWGSGEDTDYLVRAFREGCCVRRRPDLCVRHASIDYCRASLPKARAYGRGRSRLVRKHRLGIVFALLNVLYPVLNAVYRLPDRTAARYHLLLALGRIEGMFIEEREREREREGERHFPDIGIRPTLVKVWLRT
ncbi:MAG: glycosyltransferase family 2 protein [Desulfovibrio desulfuricans]|nr:glycosyltransferase family 2 protein [Desulfovibrio desulfuricans]